MGKTSCAGNGFNALRSRASLCLFFFTEINTLILSCDRRTQLRCELLRLKVASSSFSLNQIKVIVGQEIYHDFCRPTSLWNSSGKTWRTAQRQIWCKTWRSRAGFSRISLAWARFKVNDAGMRWWKNLWWWKNLISVLPWKAELKAGGWGRPRQSWLRRLGEESTQASRH